MLTNLPFPSQRSNKRESWSVLYQNMQRLSRDRREIASGFSSRCPKDERRKRSSEERPNSNGGEEGRYAITNAYFRVIVCGAMKGTTCNYHCCGCIGCIKWCLPPFFLLSSILPSLPRGNANFLRFVKTTFRGPCEPRSHLIAWSPTRKSCVSVRKFRH